MSLVVWKYDLPVNDETEVEMPYGARLLHVASQFGDPGLVTIWVLVEPTASLAKRRILMRGTGHPISLEDAYDSVRDSTYVGTVVVAGGSLVWHVFDGGFV